MTILGNVAEPDKIYMIDDANKTYSVWDLKKTRGEARSRPRQTYTVKKLGSDTVAGLRLPEGRADLLEGHVIDVCVAKDFGVSSDWLAAIEPAPEGQHGSWLGAAARQRPRGLPRALVDAAQGRGRAP